MSDLERAFGPVDPEELAADLILEEVGHKGHLRERAAELVSQLTGVPLARVRYLADVLLRAPEMTPIDQALLLIARYRQENGWQLSRERAREISERTQIKLYRVWELNKQLAADEKREVLGWDLLDRLRRYGRKGFVFDKTWEGLIYWCNGNALALLTLLSDNGFDVPSPAWVSRHWGRAPTALRCGASKGMHDKQKSLLYFPRAKPPIHSVIEIDEVVWDVEFLKPNGLPNTPRPVSGRKPTPKEKRDAETARLHALLAVDVGSLRIVAIAVSHKAMTSDDYFTLVADVCEKFRHPFDPSRELGGAPDLIVFDNATIFGLTQDDGRWRQLQEESSVSLALRADGGNDDESERAPVPEAKAHAAFWWTGKPVVEGAARISQEASTLGLAGRFTFNLRLDGTEAHNTSDLLPWRAGVWTILKSVDAVNATYSRTLGMSRDEYYLEHYTPRPSIPDAVLARWYKPHWFDNGKRIVNNLGVNVDYARWQGPGTDIAIDGDWREGLGTQPPLGATVEVRCRNHHQNLNYYAPRRAVDREWEAYLAALPAGATPLDRDELAAKADTGFQDRYLPEAVPVLGRKPDRVAIFYEGRFVGWNYAPPAPEEVLAAGRANRTEVIKGIRRNQARMRDLEGRYTHQINATGNRNMVDVIRAPADELPATADRDGAAERPDAEQPERRRAGRRPPTRRRGNGTPDPPPGRRPPKSAAQKLGDAFGIPDIDQNRNQDKHINKEDEE